MEPTMTPATTTDYASLTTAELTTELRRLRVIKAWRLVTLIERELHNRQPVELAQDAYYYGTAADLRHDG